MTTRLLKSAVAIFLGMGVAFTAVEASAEPVPATLVQVGTPAWKPTNFYLFSAPGGTDPQITEVFQLIFSQHSSGPDDPYQAHPEDFATEIGNNLEKAGIEVKTVFNEEEIAGDPLAIHLAWTAVPNSDATGITRDYPEGGPIIPNSIFPIVEDGTLFLNGEELDPIFDSTRQGSMNFSGFSHLTTLITEHAGFLDPGISLVGDYLYTETQRDPNGNGWNIAVPFTVVASNEPVPVPEPSTLVIMAGSLAALGLLRRWQS